MVISILMVIIGVIAMLRLPTAQFREPAVQIGRAVVDDEYRTHAARDQI